MAKLDDVKGVFLDYGGVIEDIQPDPMLFKKGVAILKEMLEGAGVHIEPDVLVNLLREGQKGYEDWYRHNGFRELPSSEIWCSFLLKGYCRTERVRRKIEAMAEELSSIYEFYQYKRRPPASMLHVLKYLFQNRFVLALVSNTLSRTLIPERLHKFGVERYFTTVVLSMETGVRKPARAIFEHALKQSGMTPMQCVFVGDTMSRDIEGSRKAGFRYTVLIESGITGEKDSGYQGSVSPDHTIEKIEDLLPLLTG